MSAVLLVETATGDVVAVRFPSVADARDWEEQHEHTAQAVGCFPVVTKAAALKLAAGAA